MDAGRTSGWSHKTRGIQRVPSAGQGLWRLPVFLESEPFEHTLSQHCLVACPLPLVRGSPTCLGAFHSSHLASGSPGRHSDKGLCGQSPEHAEIPKGLVQVLLQDHCGFFCVRGFSPLTLGPLYTSQKRQLPHWFTASRDTERPCTSPCQLRE